MSSTPTARPRRTISGHAPMGSYQRGGTNYQYGSSRLVGIKCSPLSRHGLLYNMIRRETIYHYLIEQMIVQKILIFYFVKILSAFLSLRFSFPLPFFFLSLSIWERICPRYMVADWLWLENRYHVSLGSHLSSLIPCWDTDREGERNREWHRDGQ